VVNAEVVDALSRAGTRAVLVVAGSDREDQGSGPVRLTDRFRKALGDLLVVVGPQGPAGADDPTSAEPVGGRAPEPRRRR